MTWLRAHVRLTVVGFVILAVGTTVTLYGMQRSTAVACSDRKQTYDALHAVIVKAYQPMKPSPAVVAAFPQLKPFYTPGSPQYEAALRRSNRTRDDVLAILGDRPSC